MTWLTLLRNQIKEIITSSSQIIPAILNVEDMSYYSSDTHNFGDSTWMTRYQDIDQSISEKEQLLSTLRSSPTSINTTSKQQQLVQDIRAMNNEIFTITAHLIDDKIQSYNTVFRQKIHENHDLNDKNVSESLNKEYTTMLRYKSMIYKDTFQLVPLITSRVEELTQQLMSSSIERTNIKPLYISQSILKTLIYSPNQIISKIENIDTSYMNAYVYEKALMQRLRFRQFLSKYIKYTFLCTLLLYFKLQLLKNNNNDTTHRSS